MKFRDKLDRKYLKIVAYVVLAGTVCALILFMGQYQSIEARVLIDCVGLLIFLKPVAGDFGISKSASWPNRVG